MGRFYKEDSHVSKHNHDDAWDSLAFAWYLDTPEDGTYLEFVTGRNYGKRIHVQKNQLLLFNGRLNHQFYGNAAKRIVCSGNLIFANERFYKPNVEVENKNVNMEQAKSVTIDCFTPVQAIADNVPIAHAKEVTPKFFKELNTPKKDPNLVTLLVLNQILKIAKL